MQSKRVIKSCAHPELVEGRDPVQKYKIIVAYDGTDFHGWQIQPRDITVTSCLQKSFKHVFGHDVSVFGASRTDAGVHALGQVAQFHTDLNVPEEKMREAWNRNLPSSIIIRSLQKVSQDFHPCANVLQKTYYYHLFLKTPLPFIARFGWHYKFIDTVDLVKFEKCMNLYVGEHDFASFCKIDPDDGEKTTIRTIDAISVKKMSHWGVLRVEVRGPGFLRYQIRRMIGYALDVARRETFTVNYLQGVMDSKDPQQELLKADGSGLCLRKVIYHDGINK